MDFDKGSRSQLDNRAKEAVVDYLDSRAAEQELQKTLITLSTFDPERNRTDATDQKVDNIEVTAKLEAEAAVTFRAAEHDTKETFR